MSVGDVIAAFQARHAALGFRAPANQPDTAEGLGTIVVVDPMNATTTWQAHAGDLTIERRIYRVRLLQEKVGFGTGVYEARARAVASLDALLASYRGDPRVTATAAIQIEASDGLRDTGVLPHPGKDNAVRYGEALYVGAEFDLMIEERYE
jgi:hypothetical protein